jgi:hypothetical protein
MPTPNEGESREDFVKRCIPIVIDDETAKDSKQAVAICNSMWEQEQQEADVGGPTTCACPECDYTVEKERGTPCRSMKCPECGADLVAGDEQQEAATMPFTNVRQIAQSAIETGLALLAGNGEIKQKDALKLLEALQGDLEALEEQDRDGAQKAKQSRAKRYGISAIDGKAITKPSEFASISDSDFGDPVNYAYPADADHARAALTYFNHADARTSGGYSEADWAKIGGRLAKLISHHLSADYKFSGGKLVQSKQAEADVAEADMSKLRSLLTQALRMLGPEEEAPEEEEPEKEAPAEELGECDLVESFEGSIALAESDVVATGARAPLKLDVVLIRPGWGNKNDMNYYPADMLRRDAKVFEGVKMYTTDHRPGEKSERTEVSKVQEIVGFTDDGAPIGRAVIFDPDFAEKTRNRAIAGELRSLECSILARGKKREGQVNGIKGHIVEAITSAASVDWVTKGGAGGHAQNLAEAETTGGDSVETNEIQTEEVERTMENEVVVAEETETTEQETWLSEDAVASILAEAKLPDQAKARLAGMQYSDEGALKEAVQAEADYVKELTKAGQPVVPQSTIAQSKPVTLAEREAAMSAVNQRWLGTRARKQQEG